MRYVFTVKFIFGKARHLQSTRKDNTINLVSLSASRNTVASKYPHHDDMQEKLNQPRSIENLHNDPREALK